MSRYIDADELIVIGLDDPDCEHQFKFVPWEFIENALTADVIEVVHCKDCIHYCGIFSKNEVMHCGVFDWLSLPYDYCSTGERRDDAEKTD